MPRGRPRKTRVTKKQVRRLREKKKKEKAISSYKRKKTVKPGPFTNLSTDLKVKATMKANNGLMGLVYGTYPRDEFWSEKGWYPIIFNITSKSIKRDVDAYGIDEYLAACEADLNSPDNQKKYGTIVILKAEVNGSQRDERSRRFVSVRAKTNKKSIPGFLAIRKGVYQVLK